jgi:site-specific recombinase XerD
MMHLGWSDVDINKRVITIQNKPELKWWTKNRKPRRIPLNDVAMDCIRFFQKERKDNFVVFDSVIRNNGNFWHRIRKMMRAANITKGNVHCTRHTFASNLIMNSVDISKVSELLGHTDLRATKIYTHLAPAVLHDAVGTLNFGRKGIAEESVKLIPFQKASNAQN